MVEAKAAPRLSRLHNIREPTMSTAEDYFRFSSAGQGDYVTLGRFVSLTYAETADR